ncbi:MAG: FAD/NAD(P)-binding protein [Holophagales bacterium]|nr:FAD/NAD(P)-binding protein [Holophagales bacterium]
MSAVASSPDPMFPRPYRVHRVTKETSDTFTLELLPEAGHAGFAFAAGQFNMLYVCGIGEVPISISGDPGVPQALVHTTRAVGAVTKGMEELKKGDSIGIRGPFGTNWPVAAAEGNDVVFVAGGIGLAPLRPALYQVLANRERYGRVVLLYGARTPEDILYRKQLKEWRADLGLEVHVSVDRATRDWRGNVGVVTTLIPRVPFDPYHTLAMVCGPEVMIRYTVMELERRGVAQENIHVSLERNMKCGVGFCGHCQHGPNFVCKDGPVFPFSKVRDLLTQREV